MLKILTTLRSLVRKTGFRRLPKLSAEVLDEILFRCRIPPLRADADGLQLVGYLHHLNLLAAVEEGSYEPYFRQLLCAAVLPGSTVVDGGAHIGWYSLQAAQRAGGRGRVYSVEANPYNCVALESNLWRNGCSNVVVVRKALSDIIGTARFYKHRNSISSSLVNRTDVGRTTPIEVPLITIDELLRKEPVETLVVKLDVEGAEPGALRGMRITAQRAGDVTCLVEVNPAALRDAGLTTDDLLREIEACGLIASAVDEARRELVAVAVGDQLRKGNLYCVRSSRRLDGAEEAMPIVGGGGAASRGKEAGPWPR